MWYSPESVDPSSSILALLVLHTRQQQPVIKAVVAIATIQSSSVLCLFCLATVATRSSQDCTMTAMLPDEVVYLIFSYLDPLSLRSVLQCNTTFYRIATTPALWELPYLLRWSTGDSKREAARGTDAWRKHRQLQRLAKHATRAAAEQGLTTASTSLSPFRNFQPNNGPVGDSAPPLKLDFYRLFLERIRIDQEVLDTLYEQVVATHCYIPPVVALARKFGNDAKDVLAAVVEAQQSGPSWSSSGFPDKAFSAATSQDNGKQLNKNDPLVYNADGYRLSAYRAHLPTTLRSETHHLVILHHAREMLEHLQRREAMQRLSDLALPDPNTNTNINPNPNPESWSPHLGSTRSAKVFPSKQTEWAISLLTMFRGGEATYVENQLDILAAACDLYLQQRFPENSFTRLSVLEVAKGKATAICDFLADHGFRGAREDLFSDLDNHFLHHCFTTNRETLPLSLTLIFCGVANRLGLVTSLCNYPMRVLALVSLDPEAPLPTSAVTVDTASEEMFWLDVCEYTTVAYDAHEPTAVDRFARRHSWLQQRPPVLDHHDLVEWIHAMGIPNSADFWRPADPIKMVLRAADNILSSLQRARTAPRNQHPVGQARNALRNIELDRRSARLEQQWRELKRVDHTFLSLYHGRTDPVQHGAIADQIASALDGVAPAIEEDETLWHVARTWRTESMRTLSSQPESWVLPSQTPSQQFRAWMDARAADNDWTLTRMHLHRRSDHWSPHEQQAAKYAAVNAFLRLKRSMSASEVDWIAGSLQHYFMLDVDVIERDFLGLGEADVGTSSEGDGGESEEGSDSSDEEDESSLRRLRISALTNRGILTSPNTRTVLSRMMKAVWSQDAKVPRVDRRVRRQEQRNPKLTIGMPSAEQSKQLAHRVGTIFRHRTYRYAGSILCWDPCCIAPEDWIVNMGVDRLPAPRTSTMMGRGGRHQPFYHSQVADGTLRYVADVNVELIHGPIWIYGLPPNESTRRHSADEHVVEEGRTLGMSMHKMLQLRGIGEYFRCFDQVKGRFRRNEYVRVRFPDDLSDTEEEEPKYGGSDSRSRSPK